MGKIGYQTWRYAWPGAWGVISAEVLKRAVADLRECLQEIPDEALAVALDGWCSRCSSWDCSGWCDYQGTPVD